MGESAMEAVLDRLIVSEPGYRGGRPRIAGTRITGADVKQWYLQLGMSLEEIAATYDLSLAAVYAAMAYYYDHQAEIERSIAEDEAFVEAMRAQQPSLLQAKLRQRSITL
ncbi:MAG: hypothetical protein BroJett021_30150 [Chloroflexota bacterium]|nr:MAG: hypothetical protein BroJett021_30150 [Chloroflexota bacterium]